MELIKERRLEIARRILAEMVAAQPSLLPSSSAGATASSQSPTRGNESPTDETRRRKAEWQKVLRSPIKDASVFYMKAERQLIEVHKSDELTRRMYRILSAAYLPHLTYVLRTIVVGLEASLFGCSVTVGIFPRADTLTVDFHDITTGEVTVLRRPADCFDCIDKLAITLVSNTKEGDLTAFVPIANATGPLGIIRIDHIMPEDFTTLQAFDRSTSRMKASMKKGKYKFLLKRVLWRLPFERAKVSDDQVLDHSVYLYSSVRGRVIGVHYDHLGLPYYGGPRFSLIWEDGVVEKGVSKYELMDTYAKTPRSLGELSLLSESLKDVMQRVADTGAKLLYNRRNRDEVRRLRASVMQATLKFTDIAYKCLESVISIVHGTALTGLATANVECSSVSRLMKLDGTSIASKRDGLPLLAAVQSASNGIAIVENGLGGQWMVFELPVESGFVWGDVSASNAEAASDNRYFLYVLRSKISTQEALQQECAFLREVSAVCGAALGEGWRAEQRKTARKVMLNDLELSMRRSTSTYIPPAHRASTATVVEADTPSLQGQSVDDLCRSCVNSACTILPGAHVYLALLRDSRNAMQFTNASSSSGMVGNVLHRGEGVSFEVLDSLDTLVVEERLSNELCVGTKVRVKYGRHWYDAEITKLCGHGFCNVRYMDLSTEAGVHQERIIKASTKDRLLSFGSYQYPFVSIPLRNKDKAIGVINIDNFSSVPKASYESHPENGVLIFLKNIGKLFGWAIDSRRKQSAIDLIDKVGNNINAEYADVLDALINSIFLNVLGVSSGIAGRYVYEKSSNLNADAKLRDVNALLPPSTAPSTMFRKSLRSSFFRARGKTNTQDSTVSAAAAAAAAAAASSKPLSWVSVLTSRGSDDEALKEWLRRYDHLKSSHKPVQFIGGMARLSFFLKSHVSLQEPVILLAAFWQQSPNYFEVDSHFIEAAHRSTQSAMQKLAPRRARMIHREKCINEIKIACSLWSSRSKLLYIQEVVKALRTCYRGANIHIARMMPNQDSLHFFYSSTESRFKNENFTRCGDGSLLFEAVDTMKSILINSNSKFEPYNGIVHNIDWIKTPCVIIPLICRIDACIGVLCIDSFGEKSINVSKDGDDFKLFCLIAVYLSFALDQYYTEEAKKVIDSAVDNCETFDEGLVILEGALCKLLPDVHAINHVCYSPALDDSQMLTSTTNELILFVCLESIDLVSFLESGSVELYSQGIKIFDSRLRTGPLPTLRVLLSIGTAYTDNAIEIHLVALVHNNLDKISRKCIQVHELLTNPASVIFYDLSSPKLYPKSLGTVAMRTVLLDSAQQMGYTLRALNLYDSSVHPVLEKPFFEITRGGCIIEQQYCDNNASDRYWAATEKFIPIYSRDVADKCDLIFRVQFRSFRGVVSIMLSDLTTNGVHEILRDVSDDVDGSTLQIGVIVDPITAASLSIQEFSEVMGFVAFEFDAEITNESFIESPPESHYILRVLEARHFDIALPSDSSPNICVRVVFNGIDVGYTSIIRDAFTPIWFREPFTLIVPSNSYLFSCMLKLHLIHKPLGLEESIVLGTITISGPRLVHLLTGQKTRKKWYSLLPPNHHVDIDGYEAEILISGRPASVQEEDYSESSNSLRLTIENIIDIPIRDIVDRDLKPSDMLFLRIFFNDRIVHESKHIGAMTDSDETTFSWDSETFLFDSSAIRLLEQSSLRFELWIQQDQYKSLLSTATLQKWDIVLLLGQNGLRVVWIPCSFKAHLGILTKAKELVRGMFKPANPNDHTFHGRLKVIGGEAKHTKAVEEDGRTFFVDTLVAMSIYNVCEHLQSPKTSVGFLCKVYWNDCYLGETKSVVGSTEPSWGNCRFTLRPPVPASYADSLLVCTLHIELWMISDVRKVCLGYIDLTGQQLDAFVNSSAPISRWFHVSPLHRATGKTAYKVSNGRILLRGGNKSLLPKNINDKSSFLSKFKILFASSLPRLEVFELVRPFIKVVFNGEEISRTVVCSRNQNPTFNHMFTIMTAPVDFKLNELLSFEVYSFVEETSEELYLCSFELDSSMMHACVAGRKKEFSATRTTSALHNADATARLARIAIVYEEEQLPSVLDSDKLSDIWDLSSPLKSLTEISLTIMAAQNLEKANLVGLSDPYCVVSWGSQYIGTTPVIYNTINPVWNFESSFTFRLPTTIASVLSDSTVSEQVKINLEHENEVLVLTIDVFDRNQITQDVYLGSAELTFADLHSLLTGGLPALRWLELQKSKRFSKGLVGGRVKIMLDSSDTNATSGLALGVLTKVAQGSGKVISLTVRRARDLANVDLFDQADPFARVYWNGLPIGQTRVISNSLSPTWNQTFFLPTPSEIEVDQCCLYIEMYSWSRISSNTFLGSIELSHHDVMWAAENQPSKEMWLDLTQSRFLPIKNQSHIHGKVEIGLFEVNSDSSPSHEASDSTIDVQPSTKSRFRKNDSSRPDCSFLYSLYDEFCLHVDKRSGLGCIALTVMSFYPTEALSAFCLVTIDQRQIHKSELSDDFGCWSSTRLYLDIEKLKDSQIIISITAILPSGTNSAIGSYTASVSSLLAIAPTESSFLLRKLDGSTTDAIVKLSVEVQYERWNSKRLIQPKSCCVSRRLVLVGGNDLALVNGHAPNVYCEIFSGDVLQFTSTISAGTEPRWKDSVAHLSIEFDSSIDVKIWIMHVDEALNLSICIGVCHVPVDAVVSPTGTLEGIICMPPAHNKQTLRKPSSGRNDTKEGLQYKFLTSGSISIAISDSNDQKFTDLPFICRSSSVVVPLLQLCCSGNVEASAPSKSYGCINDYVNSSLVPLEHNTLVYILGNDLKGHLQSIVLRRKRDFYNASACLHSLADSLKIAFFKLNRRNYMNEFREKCKIAFKSALESYMNDVDYTLDNAHWIFGQFLLRSFPSCSAFTATASQNLSSFELRRYSSDMHYSSHMFQMRNWQGQSKVSQAFIFPDRNIDVIQSIVDLRKSSFLVFGPLSRESFPRISVPFSLSEEGAGFFGIECLSSYLGGKDETFSDLKAIQSFLLDAGSFFSESIMRNAEKAVHVSLTKYTSSYRSTYSGLLEQIAKESFGHIRDCRMLEIWQLSESNQFTSLASCSSSVPTVPGITVVLRKFTMSTIFSDADNSSRVNLVASHRILSYEFGGVSQCHFMSLKTNKDWIVTEESVVTLHKVFEVQVKVVDLNDDLSVVQEFKGVLIFESLIEDQVKCTLKDSRGKPSFEAVVHTLWQRQSELTNKSINLNNVRGFSLTLHGCKGLLSKSNFLNAYCDVYWEGQFFARTPVAEGSCDPEWKDTIFLPFKGKSSPIVLEVYDMVFSKRGSFLGRLEIPFSDCCFVATARTAILQKSPSLPVRKQKFVGGEIHFGIKVLVNDGSVEDDAAALVNNGTTRESVSLTIHSCCDLSKVDAFGSADPYVIGYFDGSSTPVFATSVVYNNINPEWNQSFDLDLRKYDGKGYAGPPPLHIEVWDHNNLRSNVFLGCSTVLSSVYLTSEMIELSLGPSLQKTAKENRYARGILKLSFNARKSETESIISTQQFVNGVRTIAVVRVLNATIPNDSMVQSSKLNPFVSLQLSGLPIGSTKHQSNLCPKWENEVFNVDVYALLASHKQTLTFELKSLNIYTNIVEVLGEFPVKAVDLLHPTSVTQQIVLPCRILHIPYEFECSITYSLCLNYEYEKLDLKSIRYDENNYLRTSSQANSQVLSLHPITEDDTARGKWRLDWYTQHPFDRHEYWQRDHYDQLVTASNLGAELSLQVFPAEFICFPSVKTSNLGTLNIVTRSSIGKMTSNMKSFVYNMNATIASRLDVLFQRELRRKNLDLLPDRLENLHIKDCDPIKSLECFSSEIHSTVGGCVEFYIHSGSNRNALLRVVASGHSEYPELSLLLVERLCSLCKFRIILQMFRSEIHLHSMHSNTSSQINLRSIASYSLVIDSLLGKDFCKELEINLNNEMLGGCFIVPMIGADEVFIGLLVIRSIDAFPTVVYDIDIKINPLDRVNLSSIIDIGMIGMIHTDSSHIASTFIGLEEGHLACFTKIGPIIGTTLLKVMLNQAKQNIQGFIVDCDHTFADVVKFVFQQICMSCPVIHELSLWRAYSCSDRIGHQIKDGNDVEIDHVFEENILVGTFQSQENSFIENRNPSIAGDIKALFSKNKWTVKLPWVLDISHDYFHHHNVKKVMASLTERIILLPMETLQLALEEIKKAFTSTETSRQYSHLHTGQTLVALSSSEIMEGIYSRLLDCKFPGHGHTHFDMSMTKKKVLESSASVIESSPTLFIAKAIDTTSAALIPSLPGNIALKSKAKDIVGTSYISITDWNLESEVVKDPMKNTNHTVVADANGTLHSEDDDSNHCIAKSARISEELNKYFLCAAGRGLRGKGCFGVIGPCISSFLCECVTIMEPLLSRIAELEIEQNIEISQISNNRTLKTVP